MEERNANSDPIFSAKVTTSYVFSHWQELGYTSLQQCMEVFATNCFSLLQEAKTKHDNYGTLYYTEFLKHCD